MLWLYSTFIHLFALAARCSIPFSSKAEKWYKGRGQWKDAARILDDSHPIWIHCASVGEFEQARPLIEMLRTNSKDSKILLSFFSPSGFELRKDYEWVDAVCYLPIDSKKNAQLFLDAVNPSQVIFVKYEFWFNFMNAIHSRHIPMTLICAHFPTNHFLVTWPGSIFGKRLGQFSRVFVQNQESVVALKNIGVEKVEIAGDTRFDRVAGNKASEWNNRHLESFKGDDQLIVVGSNWIADDNIILDTIRKFKSVKIVVAPHEDSPQQLKKWRHAFKSSLITFSEVDGHDMANYQVLYVDTVGLLSRIYKYADVAYVGGGFGHSVHNTLEPAVFGIPLIFGPKNDRFLEIQEIKKLEVGQEVHDAESFEMALNKALTDIEYRKKVDEMCQKYFEENVGATNKIFQSLELHKPKKTHPIG